MTSYRDRWVIKRAIELGTFRKLDRSKQYDEQDPEHRSAAALLRSQNHLWKYARRLHLWLKILTTIVTLFGAVQTILKALK